MAEEEKMVIPDDLKARLKKLVEASGITKEAVLERLKDIMDTDEKIATMDKDEFKVRYAVARLLKEQVSSGNTTDFYIMPTLHASHRNIKSDSKYVGNIAGLVKKIETEEDGTIIEGDVEYGAGTIWRDGAKQLDKLIKGKVYKAAFIAEKNSWGWDLGGNNPGFAEVEDVKFPTIEEFYTKEIEPMGNDVVLSDMDMDQSKNFTDVKILNITILDGDVAERPDHSEYGYYDMNDDSFINKKKGIQGQRLFLDVRDVELETGCKAKVGCHIIVRNKKLNITPHFIIPVGNIQKKIFEPKSESPQDTVDPNDLNPKEDEDDF